MTCARCGTETAYDTPAKRHVHKDPVVSLTANHAATVAPTPEQLAAADPMPHTNTKGGPWMAYYRQFADNLRLGQPGEHPADAGDTP